MYELSMIVGSSGQKQVLTQENRVLDGNMALLRQKAAVFGTWLLQSRSCLDASDSHVLVRRPVERLHSRHTDLTPRDNVFHHTTVVTQHALQSVDLSFQVIKSSSDRARTGHHWITTSINRLCIDRPK
ncbi:hypothetical protein TNCV_3857731 [Trichonephila clavipes]|nr:hypothetical protein TNCV_3857731 [Trichonephila clavipes]